MLEQELFSLGHVKALRPGPNTLTFQGKPFRLHRTGNTIEWNKSKIDPAYRISEQTGILWAYPAHTQPKIPVWPQYNPNHLTLTFSTVYKADFKLVLENLYDLNHVAGTYGKINAQPKLKVENVAPDQDVIRFDLTMEQTFDSVRRPVFTLLNYLSSKSEDTESSHRVEVRFPSVLTFPNGFRLGEFFFLAIYPVDATYTGLSIFTVLDLPKTYGLLLQPLYRFQNNQITNEDRNILEQAALNYPRKIRLAADKPVDYARTLWEQRLMSELNSN